MAKTQLELGADTSSMEAGIRRANASLKSLEDRAKGTTAGLRSIEGIFKATGILLGVNALSNALQSAYRHAKELGDNATAAQKAFVKVGDAISSFKLEYLNSVAETFGSIAEKIGLINREEMIRQNNQEAEIKFLQERNRIMREYDALAKSTSAKVVANIPGERTGANIRNLDEETNMIVNLEGDIANLRDKLANTTDMVDRMMIKGEIKGLTYNVEDLKKKRQEISNSVYDVAMDDIRKITDTMRDRGMSEDEINQNDLIRSFYEAKDNWEDAAGKALNDLFTAENTGFNNLNVSDILANPKGVIEGFNKKIQDLNLVDAQKEALMKYVESSVKGLESTSAFVNKKYDDEIELIKANAKTAEDTASKTLSGMALIKELENIEFSKKSAISRSEINRRKELTEKFERVRAQNAAGFYTVSGAISPAPSPEMAAYAKSVSEQLSRDFQKSEEAQKEQDKNSEESSKKREEREKARRESWKKMRDDETKALVEEGYYMQAIAKLEEDIADLDEDAVDYLEKKRDLNLEILDIKKMQKKEEEDAAVKKGREALEGAGLQIDSEGGYFRMSKSGKKIKVSKEDAIRSMAERAKNAQRTEEINKRNINITEKKTPRTAEEYLRDIADALAIQENKGEKK